MERGRRFLPPAIGYPALGMQSRTRGAGNARERLRTQMSSDLFNVFVMSHLKRRTELLRKQIADESNPAMPQHDALIEQRECRIGIAFVACALGETRGGHAS